ncbi:MAG: nickel-dependent hydrogenase large subunit [Rhodocyclaceae bacterium]|nr:nickel-dependent hydrogenase large subunit [Gammaproteobacteria bacterium]MCB1889933.1 nickel-dependent hydrogenase large subunit [Rhodocyclaceae bacterium]
MSRVVLGPFNRVEGDLEVTLDVDDGRVRSARVNSPLYRGFEQILRGKHPFDAMVFVPRICGICSVSQSVASALALRDALQLEVPPNGDRVTNLLLACENVADHLTHFYLFFMPDFARAAYAGEAWHAAVKARFEAVSGRARVSMLPARARFMHLMGLLGGKWPHTLSLQPGGSARAVSGAEVIRLFAILREFRGWLERELFGDALEAVAAIDSAANLARWAAARSPASSDFACFLEVADALGLAALGRGTGRFLSVGTYRIGDAPAYAGGVWDGALRPFRHEDVVEDITSSWMMAPSAPAHPWAGDTEPDMDKDGAYSWCKAPRWQGQVVECGALARQVVDGHPLARSLAAVDGGSVSSRVVGRLLEIARTVIAMETWIREIRPGEPFCQRADLPEEARGVGLVEAARGALGHWLVIRKGRIANYQIIAPTTWNFSPRDQAGTPGALEQALVGAAVPAGEGGALQVQHVVRSFDPCMVCTVH